jgi:predicted ArsR family transcriptional regulator
MTWDSPQRTRRDDILAFICLQSKENNGVPPSAREIARHFGMHLKTVQSHLEKLANESRISWIGGDGQQRRIRVERASWEEPPDVEL